MLKSPLNPNSLLYKLFIKGTSDNDHRESVEKMKAKRIKEEQLMGDYVKYLSFLEISSLGQNEDYRWRTGVDVQLIDQRHKVKTIQLYHDEHGDPTHAVIKYVGSQLIQHIHLRLCPSVSFIPVPTKE